ncbi:rhamnose/proton symporter RhaT [Granulicella sp. WH15]|uniref:L-rhamnose/proton symporter RhaT n=1 Tax=Granulicella sp. WH15 TaxID=2602070 RepID=UPI0013671C01|nr:L-rhamnose/proton symporter RhaT [Granulicella sp. WH15]QHN02963.1 rhamnose/proton symporter RhaT [Granulicella sp. WH15]
MNPNPFLGVLFHWTGGLSAASCYLPFRGIRQWSWEIYWLVQGCFSWIVAPLLLAALLVPELGRILHSADSSTIFYAWFWGAMWGIGGLLFGLGVRYLGIALGYTIALGFSTAFGTLVPPLFAGQLAAIAAERAGQVILLGVAVCLAAIVVSGIAGHMKERELAGARANEAASPGGRGEFAFSRGIVIASFAGIMGACFDYGLAAGKPISDAARDTLAAHSRSGLWQSLPALVVVLWGGFTTNALWCGGLLLRNRSASQFLGRSADSDTSLGPRRTLLNYAFAALAGLLWYFQFFFYSMGQTKMGRYDFSSWTLHMAGTILFATLWGAVLHEWSGTSRKTRSTGALGFALLVASTLVVGYGNYLKSR